MNSMPTSSPTARRAASSETKPSWMADSISLRAVAVAVGHAAGLLELAAIQEAASHQNFAGFHSVGLVR